GLGPPPVRRAGQKAREPSSALQAAAQAPDRSRNQPTRCGRIIAMRNVRALCGLAVIAAAFGCGGGSEESGKGAQAPSHATTETPPPETSQTQPPATPGEQEMGQATTPPPAQPAPGGAGQAPMAPTVSSNDLLMGTFVCMLGPLNLDRSASMGMSGGS